MFEQSNLPAIGTAYGTFRSIFTVETKEKQIQTLSPCNN